MLCCHVFSYETLLQVRVEVSVVAIAETLATTETPETFETSKTPDTNHPLEATRFYLHLAHKLTML